MNYQRLFSFALSFALSRGEGECDDVAQDAVIGLWMRCDSDDEDEQKAWVVNYIKSAMARKVAGYDSESARVAKVRYRPIEVEWEESKWEGVGEDMAESVSDRVFLEEVRTIWKDPWKCLDQVRVWAS